jgi:hypothetical protein
LIKPYFHAGVPYTHDGENHLARFANYKIALKEGQFPPRFAPNLNNHYGYPVFNYNYPLANILSVPFSILGISYELTFKILMISAVLLGCWGIYQWLTALKLGNWQLRVLTIVSWLLAPFTVNLIYVRGNIGELWAMALFPWLLWLTHQFHEDKQVPYWLSSGLITGFLLSHNISVLFGGIFWLIYSLVILGKNRAGWGRLSWRGILSLGLSLWFWLPAMAEKNQVILDNADLTGQFSQHFPTLAQLISAPLQFGYSFTTPVDTMSFALGLSGLVGLILGTVLVVKIKKPSLKRKYLWLSLVMGWLLLFFQTNFSYQLWRTLPLVQFIQFPWRLSLYLVIIILPLITVLLDRATSLRYLFIAIFAIQLLAVSRFQPADYFHRNTIDYDLFSQSTSTANENMPVGFSYAVTPVTELVVDWSPAPKIAQGSAEIEVASWTGTKRSYSLNVKERSLVFEPTFYFAGWETTVNNKQVEYATMSETEGRIGYWLEPGQYEIQSEFTQKTWSRILGNTISAVAGAVILWFVVHEVANLKIKK